MFDFLEELIPEFDGKKKNKSGNHNEHNYENSHDYKQKPNVNFGNNNHETRGNFCTNCGFSNPSGAKFCGGCGTGISSVNTCSKCGSETKSGAVFCSECGNKL